MRLMYSRPRVHKNVLETYNEQTDSYIALTRVPAHHNQDNFRFRHAALANVLKSNVALIIAKTAALRVNLNACRYAYLTESVPIYMLLAVNFNVDDCQLPSRRGVRLSFSSCHMAKRRVGV